MEGKSAHVAVIHAPERNFGFDLGAKYFDQAKDLGLVVSNGTFFKWLSDGGLQPLGRLIRDGREIYRPPQRRMVIADGRLVDLGLRWGMGIDAQGKPVAVRDQDADSLRTFVGGGIILLKDGKDMSASNRAVAGRYGASFSDAELDDKTSRLAIGARPDGAMLVLYLPRSPSSDSGSMADVLQMMRDLGASDAVLYDSGRAAGFSAGAPGQDKDYYEAPDPAENLNPTHFVFSGCQ